jgi:hypothetical protein
MRRETDLAWFQRVVPPILLVVFIALLLAYAPAWSPVKAQSPPPGEPWTCSVDAIGATLTLCQPTIADLRLHLTTIVIQSTTATAGQFLLRAGTGANCGTDTVSILPSAATVPRLAYSGNALFGTVTPLATPVIAPGGNDICIICTATNTCTAQLIGYAAP